MLGDIELLSHQIRNGQHSLLYDLNNDGMMSQLDTSAWVTKLAETYFGDSNLGR